MVKLQFSVRYIKPLSFLPPPSKNISDIVNWGQEDSQEILPPSLIYWQRLHRNAILEPDYTDVHCVTQRAKIKRAKTLSLFFITTSLYFLFLIIHFPTLWFFYYPGTGDKLIICSLPLSAVCVALPALSCLWTAAAGTGTAAWRPPTVLRRPDPPPHTAAAAPPCCPSPCVSPAAVSKVQAGRSFHHRNTERR